MGGGALGHVKGGRQRGWSPPHPSLPGSNPHRAPGGGRPRLRRGSRGRTAWCGSGISSWPPPAEGTPPPPPAPAGQCPSPISNASLRTHSRIYNKWVPVRAPFERPPAFECCFGTSILDPQPGVVAMDVMRVVPNAPRHPVIAPNSLTHGRLAGFLTQCPPGVFYF